jgi:hypothetical protein
VDYLELDVDAGVSCSTAEADRDHDARSRVDECLRLDKEVLERFGLNVQEAEHPVVTLHLSRLGEDAGWREHDVGIAEGVECLLGVPRDERLAERLVASAGKLQFSCAIAYSASPTALRASA